MHQQTENARQIHQLPYLLFVQLKRSMSLVLTYSIAKPKNSTQIQNHSDQPIELGQVVQRVVSLISLLVVKMLTVLVSTISNSQVFLLKKCE